MDPKRHKMVLDTLLVKHYAGSHAYGINTASSDVDYRGVFCAPEKYVRTPFFSIDVYEDPTEEDTTYYELNHFVKLCAGMNPNVSDTLWVAKEDIVVSTPAYELLRAHRVDFLSRKVADTTVGYAKAELSRVKRKLERTGEVKQKHLAHVVRLVRMGVEVLTQGTMYVKRPDAKELLEIKNGSWSLDDVIKYADDMVTKVETLRHTSPLPEQPNTHVLAELTMEVQNLAWKNG